MSKLLNTILSFLSLWPKSLFIPPAFLWRSAHTHYVPVSFTQC